MHLSLLRVWLLQVYNAQTGSPEASLDVQALTCPSVGQDPGGDVGFICKDPVPMNMLRVRLLQVYSAHTGNVEVSLEVQAQTLL